MKKVNGKTFKVKMKEHKVALMMLITTLLGILVLYLYTENKIIAQDIVELNDYNEVTKEYKYSWISQGYQENVDGDWKTTESSQRIMEALNIKFKVANPVDTYFSSSRVYQKKNDSSYYVIPLEKWESIKEKTKEEFSSAYDEYIEIPKVIEKSFFETLIDQSDLFELPYKSIMNQGGAFIMFATMALPVFWVFGTLGFLARERMYYSNMIKNFLIIITTIVISAVFYYVSMIPLYLYCYNNINDLPQNDFSAIIVTLVLIAILFVSYELAIGERECGGDEEYEM